ncbi:MAG: DNA-binding response regulator [Acidobacteria bacterium]|nr:MAG: DNA-binding response regulator [Acidobacteriota bacterium]
MVNLRILLADDHEVVRHGVRGLLAGHPGWEVCGEATDGRDAVNKALELKPDVVVLDISMPNLNGLEATRLITQALPQTRILILTMHESEQLVREVLESGARGFLLKSDASHELVAAIEALQRHKTFFTSKVAELVLESTLRNKSRTAEEGGPREILTPREREVVQMLAEGRSTKEVATALGLSVKTAETHRSNIMRKLNVHSISELVLFAVRNNIVQVA